MANKNNNFYVILFKNHFCNLINELKRILNGKQ